MKKEEISVKYFQEDLVLQVSSFLNLEEEAKKEKSHDLIGQIKCNYKELDLKLKSEIKEELLKLKSDFEEDINQIRATRDNTIKENEALYQNKEQTKENQKEFDSIKKGAETVCKRAIMKRNTKYYEDMRLIKLRRSELHTEYVSILYYVTNRVSPIESLRSKAIERNATFNLKLTLTNKRFWINLVPLFMLVAIIVAYYIGKSSTGYQGDLSDVINKGIFVAVVATGAVFIYSQGGFDMSLGNASLMCATIAAITYNNTHNLAVSLLVAVLVGSMLGIINAILATMLNLPVMVMTLTMMNILAAVHEAILGHYGGLISVDDGMISNAWIYAVFLLVFFGLCFTIFNYTKVGRRNKFIGSNKVAAKFNGINLMRAGIISFAISGIGLGICGFLFACSKSGGKYGASTVLSQVGLDVVIAIVFGGMTTSGGPKSKVSCAIIGAFFAVFLDEFFNAISTPTFMVGNYCYMAKGIIFIIVSLANMWDTRGKILASGGSIQ